jgi:hypothetical protein
MNQLKVGQKFGVTKDYYVKEVITSVAQLKQILSNGVISEPIGIVTKKGNLKTISEAFLRSKKTADVSKLEQLNRFYATMVERGCFLVSYEPIEEEDYSDIVFEPTFTEGVHQQSMDAYNQGITIKGGAVTFNLIALVISLVAFKFFMHIDAIYFYIGLGIILLANIIFFIRFRKAKN